MKEQVHHLSYNNKSRLNDSEEHLYEVIDSPSSANLGRNMLNQTDKKRYKTKSDDLSFLYNIKNEQIMAKKFRLSEESHFVEPGAEKQANGNNLIPVKEILINDETNKELEFCLHSSVKKLKNDTKMSTYVHMDNTFNAYTEPEQGFYKCHKNLSDINDFDIVADFRNRKHKNEHVSSDLVLDKNILIPADKFPDIQHCRHLSVNGRGISTINLINPHETPNICCSKCNMTVSSNSSCLCINFCSPNENIRGRVDSEENSIMVANLVEAMNKHKPRRQKSNHISTKETAHCVAKNYCRLCYTLSFSEDSGNSSMSECSLNTAYNNSSSSRNDFTLLKTEHKQHGNFTPPSSSVSNNGSEQHFFENKENHAKCQVVLPLPPSHEPFQLYSKYSGVVSFPSSTASNQDEGGESGKKNRATEMYDHTSLFTERINKIRDDTDSQIFHPLKTDKSSQSGSQFHGTQTHLNIQHSSNYSSSKEHADRCHSKLANIHQSDLKEEICNISMNNKVKHNILKELKSPHNLGTCDTSPNSLPPPLPPKPQHSLSFQYQNDRKITTQIETQHIDKKEQNEKFEGIKYRYNKCAAFIAQNNTCFRLPLPQNSENARQTSYLCRLEDDGVKEITDNKTKRDKTFITHNREVAQSVQALQKLSYDLLGLIDGQQKSHLRHGKESHFSGILEVGNDAAQVNAKCVGVVETKDNNLHIIRKNTEVTNLKEKENKISELIHGQNIQQDLSLFLCDYSYPNVGASNLNQELSCNTNTECDGKASIHNKNVDEIISRKDTIYELDFPNNKLVSSCLISPANEAMELSFSADHTPSQINAVISFNNDIVSDVDCRRKLTFSPPSGSKASCQNNKMGQGYEVNKHQIDQSKQNGFTTEYYSPMKQSIESPFKTHKKQFHGKLKERLRLTSNERIRRWRKYGANKPHKSSKLAHISFIESLRSTAKESPISTLIKKGMASSAILENTGTYPCENDIEKSSFNHSSEHYNSYSEEKGKSEKCTPICSLKSTHFQSLYSPYSTPFASLFRRRNSTPLKGYKCRKGNSNMLENDHSNKSLKQKINGGKLFQARMDLIMPNKTTALCRSKFNKQYSLHSPILNTSDHQSSEEMDTNVKQLPVNKENKENLSFNYTTNFDDAIRHNLPIIPFHHPLSKLSSPPTQRGQPQKSQIAHQADSFDTYIEMTPKRSLKMRSSHLQELQCKSRQSFLAPQKTIPALLSSRDCSLNNDCITRLKKVVLEVSQENQSKEKKLGMNYNKTCLENNNLPLTSSSRSSHNINIIDQSPNNMMPSSNHCLLNGLLETHFPIKRIENKSDSANNMAYQNHQVSHGKFEKAVGRFNNENNQSHDHNKGSWVIKDENQNQQSTCNIGKTENRNCHQPETLKDGISSKTLSPSDANNVIHCNEVNKKYKEKTNIECRNSTLNGILQNCSAGNRVAVVSSETTSITRNGSGDINIGTSKKMEKVDIKTRKVNYQPNCARTYDRKIRFVEEVKALDQIFSTTCDLKPNSYLTGIEDDHHRPKINLNIDDYVKMDNVTIFRS